MLCSPPALCGRCECACLQTLACRSFLCTTSGWRPPTTAAASCLEGPAGPAWRREGGPSVPSLGHLAAQRGRGRGGRWRRGRGSTGKKRHFPSSLSLSLASFHPLCSFSFLFAPLTCFLGLLSLIFILPLPVGSLGVQLMSKSPTKTKKQKGFNDQLKNAFNCS